MTGKECRLFNIEMIDYPITHFTLLRIKLSFDLAQNMKVDTSGFYLF